MLAKGLQNRGAQVKLLAMNTCRHYVNLHQLPEEFRHITKIETADVDNRIHWWGAVRNLMSDLPYHADRFQSENFEKKLTELLRNEKYDIVQLEGLYTCLYIPAIRKNSTAKIAYRAHNVESVLWERIAENTNGIKKPYLRLQAQRLKRFEQSQLKNIDALIAISKNDASQLRKFGSSCPLFVAPFGVEINDYLSDRKQLDYPSVFHLGAMDWLPNREGIRWFLENVWNELHQRFPDMKFYVAGRDFPGWLRSWKQPGVVITGEVEDSKKFINSKAIMVVPLRSGSGMRVKIIENMALGKAIVSTPVGAEGIEYSDGVDILIAETPQKFVDCISRLVNDKRFFEEIGRNAEQLVRKKYNNDSIVKKLLEFYGSL